MACGLQVITVYAPKNFARDLLEDGVTGKIVPLEEVVFRGAIGSIISNEGMLGEIFVACRKLTEAYD